jgi:F420-dependent oxidoreductase-like protein
MLLFGRLDSMAMPHPLRFGLKLSGQDTTIQDLRAVWRIADEARFDHLWDFDHLAAIGQGGPDRPIFEGWSLLAAMAEATSHVRIGAMVTGNTYRNPALLAKIAVTVDHLSNGRLEFGIGAAWAEVEHQMYGIEGLDHRVGRLSESLQIIRSLWTQERTTFEGRYYHFKDAISNPDPIQKPYPPIWIGAGGETTLKLTARHADVWNASGAAGGDGIVDASRRLDEYCQRIGRDPATLRRSLQYGWDGGSRQELIDKAAQALERGITEHIIYIQPNEPTKLAGAVAESLGDLRALQRTAVA